MQTFPEPGLSCPPDAALRAMFEARKRVFVDLLKWDVPVLAEAYEIDQFDTPDADYPLLSDSEDCHRASARLLRTDRPHILGELFPFLCEGPVPDRADYREITRFCIEPTLARPERRKARDQLVTALVDHALATGICGFTAVAGTGWFRQIAGFGWRCRALGPGRKVGCEGLVAIEIEIDSATPAALAATGTYCKAPYRHARAGLETVS